jgi:hypothetical protein
LPSTEQCRSEKRDGAHGERASRRFIEFFTANIRNLTTPAALARGKTVLRLV